MGFEERIEKVKSAYGGDKLLDQINTLEKQLSKPGIWSNYERSNRLSKQLSDLQKDRETLGMVELYYEQKSFKELEKVLNILEKKLYLSGKYDKNDTFLSIYAGVGGIDAMDWADILLRMYMRYSEKVGYKYTILSKMDGEEAGIKSATLLVYGLYSYGMLKREMGVHRLIRLSPFNAKNLRQTSFAKVEVIPKIDKNKTVKLNSNDLIIDTFKASGAGGQHVNTTDSAVRIKHVPTGIIVSCQQERNQLKNREIAMQMLQSKLIALEESKRKKVEKKLKGEYQEAGWGHQIRSYVMHPYKLVKDLRTNVESANVEKILDGEIDKFIHAQLSI